MFDLISRQKMPENIFKLKCNLMQLISKTHPETDLSTVEGAIHFAYNAHYGQFRKSGEEYITHPLAVAEILAQQGFETVSIVTAILHDTIEDTYVEYDDIKKHFGLKIAKLVEGVSKLGKIKYAHIQMQQAENIRKLLLAMSEDIRVLLVKLADRIHNMRTINNIQDERKRRRIAKETLEIYSTLAERMGMRQFKEELQDLSFQVLFPDIFDSIKNRLLLLSKKGSPSVDMIKKDMSSIMEKCSIDAKISGRLKSIYSIWGKMQKKKTTFEQLSDILAFRIIVPKIEDCYRVIGALHLHKKFIPGTFKDYISIPKENGYRSLHTVIIDDNFQRIEVQIRTEAMHDIAEFGVASHWSYKQNKSLDSINEISQFKWINQLIEMLKDTKNPKEFLESAKLEMYNDKIFCFTPNGSLISLPKGATAIDFAFAIHSDLGLHCSKALINGKSVKITSRLQSGDQVEIVPDFSLLVNKSWEKLTVTSKARNAIRKFLKQLKHNCRSNIGRILLIKYLKEKNKAYSKENIHLILKHFNINSLAEFLYFVGIQKIQRQHITNCIENMKPDKAFLLLGMNEDV
ncbi:GTP pyrophosphokinase rsh N-terminal domain protein [Candidatus Cyrtobacter comes]|uniref:GTP diphosphokinase n=1 Tax=Candidatus Cyrtobacter comes TaxID=675776 RepID=A0ABU5L879_9RICK|nr:RelA/SpoT family protein [Candidatus Cyrtobacter comes]MDZ5762110.1 GTP pyrophosphokinase rsh N-terminal domain protein [Candidatus Cyrtobacter comes]